MLPQPYYSVQLAKAYTNSREFAIGQKIPAQNSTLLKAQLSQADY